MGKYLCTRPQLAALLQENGHQAERTVNPWKPHMSAWLFNLNADMAKIIVSYYEGIGKEAPARMRELLDEQ